LSDSSSRRRKEEKEKRCNLDEVFERKIRW
jgi:hypothetical protein